MTKTKEKTPSFAELEAALQEKEKPEEQLQLCLEFMKEALACESRPSFRDFWACKKICLSLFKEKLSPRMRSLFWSDYIELSQELRKIKEILKEKSSFTFEQLELAIASLEQDVAHFDELLAKGVMMEWPEPVNALREHFSSYKEQQQAIYLLSSLGTRIHALRKEIIHTEIRIRIKNRLLERLVKAGDFLFPKRRELITQISERFLLDVQAFVKGQEEVQLFSQCRNELQSLQAFAKEITLNSQTFSAVRNLLSNLWDEMKQRENSWKKERSEEKKRSRVPKSRIREKQGQKLEMKWEKLEAALSSLEVNGATLSFQQLSEQLKALEEEVATLSTASVKEVILHGRWQHLTEIAWEKEACSNKERLREIEGRKRELKTELSRVRKMIEGSSLDIEGAILYQEYFEHLKARIAYLEELVENLED